MSAYSTEVEVSGPGILSPHWRDVDGMSVSTTDILIEMCLKFRLKLKFLFNRDCHFLLTVENNRGLRASACTWCPNF